jgi:hypothetical protein
MDIRHRLKFSLKGFRLVKSDFSVWGCLCYSPFASAFMSWISTGLGVAAGSLQFQDLLTPGPRSVATDAAQALNAIQDIGK